MKAAFEDPADLDGFEELSEVYQEKVRKAYETGHVDDEDIPESARKPEESGKEDDNAEGKKKKSGKTSKKRVRVRQLKFIVLTGRLIFSKDEDGEEEKDDEKPKKKAAAPRKRSKVQYFPLIFMPDPYSVALRNLTLRKTKAPKKKSRKKRPASA